MISKSASKIVSLFLSLVDILKRAVAFFGGLTHPCRTYTRIEIDCFIFDLIQVWTKLPTWDPVVENYFCGKRLKKNLIRTKCWNIYSLQCIWLFRVLKIVPDETSKSAQIQESFCYNIVSEDPQVDSQSPEAADPSQYPDGRVPAAVLMTRFGRRIHRPSEFGQLLDLNENKHEITFDFEDEMDILVILNASEYLSDDGKRAKE